MKFIENEPKRNEYSLNYWTMGTKFRVAGSVALAIVLFVTGLTLGIRGISKSQSHEACNHYATANGRPTKFVTYTFWSWDCLTPNAKAPGTWISNSNPTLVGQ